MLLEAILVVVLVVGGSILFTWLAIKHDKKGGKTYVHTVNSNPHDIIYNPVLSELRKQNEHLSRKDP